MLDVAHVFRDAYTHNTTHSSSLISFIIDVGVCGCGEREREKRGREKETRERRVRVRVRGVRE